MSSDTSSLNEGAGQSARHPTSSPPGTVFSSAQDNQTTLSMDNPAADFTPEIINRNGHGPNLSDVKIISMPLEGDISNTEPNDDGIKLKDKLSLTVERSVYNQPEFDEEFEGGPRLPKSCGECCGQIRKKCVCSHNCWLKFVKKRFPFVTIFRSYNPKTDLLGDVISGLTVGIMQIPQGMAYAMLAGLEPVYGLYTSFFPVLFYFFFGTSRHVSLGTFAVVSLMIGTAVDTICNKQEGSMSAASPTSSPSVDLLNDTTNMTTGEYCPIQVATAVTLLGGLIQLAMGALQLGFVTMYLAEPLTRGFTTGAAMHVFTSQIKSVFGVAVPRHNGPLKLIYSYIDLFSNITTTNPAAVVVTIISMTILFVVKEFANPPVKKKLKAPIPIDLVIVILATVASALMDFEGNYGVQIVGDIPKGLPPPQFPRASYMSQVIGDAVAVGIVAFAISVSMVQLFAKKHNYPVDSNQELIAYGLCNIISCNFSCYLTCVSLSRSMVQESVGGHTQLAGLISSAVVLIVILALADLFKTLPHCVLAAIIIVALKGLFLQFLDLKRLWRSSKWDFSIWLVTFLGVFLMDVDIGLGVGVGWSFLTTVFRTQRPHCAILGRVPNTDIYKDIKVYATAREVAGVKIFGFEAPIYYANTNYFLDQLYRKTQCNPKKVKRRLEKAAEKTQASENEIHSTNEQSPVSDTHVPNHHIVIDCSTMGYLDTMGVGALQTVIQEYGEIRVTVFLAAMKDGVREMLESGGFYDKIPRNTLFTTVHDAVIASLGENEKLTEKHQYIQGLEQQPDQWRQITYL